MLISSWIDHLFTTQICYDANLVVICVTEDGCYGNLPAVLPVTIKLALWRLSVFNYPCCVLVYKQSILVINKCLKGRPTHWQSSTHSVTYAGTEMSSFWRTFRHWVHRKLSFWQLSMHPMIKISSKWQYFFCSIKAEILTPSMLTGAFDCIVERETCGNILRFQTLQMSSYLPDNKSLSFRDIPPTDYWVKAICHAGHGPLWWVIRCVVCGCISMVSSLWIFEYVIEL